MGPRTSDRDVAVIIAFDPSLSCTGFAVTSLDGRSLVDCGIITDDASEGAGPYDRSKSIADQAMDLIEVYATRFRLGNGVRAVVVEQPQTFSIGLGGKRSAATAPNYGICVGVVTAGCDFLRDAAYPFELLTPSASEWTRGYPGTKGDAKKRKRVAFAASLFGVPVEWFGPKTDAGNVADAALLGHWAAGRIGHEGSTR